ncbi:modular serine protease-like [Planococcus citri]|uniref:modular serine protease-like n=1 Tax=Planococcus citri TaxID=170843 RepID=UPI0031F89E32
MKNIILYIFLISSCLHLLQTSVLESENQEEKMDDCLKQEFKCDNGQCVDKSFLCDGILDCEDNSDETTHHCSNTTCKENFFQCDYGGCIEEKYICDDLDQCHDGSDESAYMCYTPRLARKDHMCIEPPSSVDKTISYMCIETIGPCVENGLVREYTLAQIKCNSGYFPIDDKNSDSSCLEGNWLFPIKNCTKRCEKLTPMDTNVDLRCYYKGLKIPCNVDSLPSGTKVRPKCKPYHTYSDYRPSYAEITCDDEGKWDNPLFLCALDCKLPLPINSGAAARGLIECVGSPWHVAIYNRDHLLICGGTIIHPRLVVSAAHCFYNEDTGRTHNFTDYEIIASKFTRNYSKIDNENQKAYKIKEIRLSGKGYMGLNNYFTADIAILILERNITFKPTVLQAHVDWQSLVLGEYPPEGTLGKVAGWGLDENGRYTEALMAVSLPYISRARCLITVPDDFRAYISFDKFCAGSDKEDSPSVLQGDSGGGIFFQKDGIFYLRGIVSVKQASLTSIAAFTDLSDHARWILSVINEIDKVPIDEKLTLCSLGKTRG